MACFARILPAPELAWSLSISTWRNIEFMATLIHENEISRGTPRERPGDTPTPYADQLAHDLGERLEGEVRFDDGARALYATDASNYRQVPIGVVIPKSIEDVIAAVA